MDCMYFQSNNGSFLSNNSSLYKHFYVLCIPPLRDQMADCCYNIITTTPFSLREEGKQRMECKY